MQSFAISEEIKFCSILYSPGRRWSSWELLQQNINGVSLWYWIFAVFCIEALLYV